ncbi:TRAFAC class myosin-kinesin ATPase superfamily [Mactra antiquata]
MTGYNLTTSLAAPRVDHWRTKMGYQNGCRPQDGVRDMIVISDIDENGINENLKTRYKKDIIYVSFELN